MSLEVKRQNIPYRPALEAGLRQEAAAIKGGKGFLCQWGRMIARIGMATTGKGVQRKVTNFFRVLLLFELLQGEVLVRNVYCVSSK